MKNSAISPSIFNGWHICPRQAWLMHHQLSGEQENPFLDIGRLIQATAYRRERKEVYLHDCAAIIDLITRSDGKFMVAEIKKSSKKTETSALQLKYYLYLLRKKGIKAAGELRFPVEKKRIKVELSEEDIQYIEEKQKEIKELITRPSAPAPKRIRLCGKCAHNEFCWS